MVGVPKVGSLFAAQSILKVTDDGLDPEIDNDPPLSIRNASALPVGPLLTVESNVKKLSMLRVLVGN